MNKLSSVLLGLFLSCVFIAMNFGNQTFAQSKNGKGCGEATITEIGYTFPMYDSVQKEISRFVSKKDYEAVTGDPNIIFKKMQYCSDGLKVIAYVCYARNTSVKGRLPVIIYNRGGANRGDVAPHLITSFSRLAKDSFIIVAPLLRQSDGGQGKDELGGSDLNDIKNVYSILPLLPFADTANIFMYGESRGGMMTYQAMREKFRINAAAVYGAFTDVSKLIKDNPKVYTSELLSNFWGTDFEQKKDSIFYRLSAIKWRPTLTSPVLIMQGTNDRSVDPVMSLQMATELQLNKQPYQLIMFEGDNHTLNQNQVLRDKQAGSWFKKYIK